MTFFSIFFYFSIPDGLEYSQCVLLSSILTVLSSTTAKINVLLKFQLDIVKANDEFNLNDVEVLH